MGKKYLEFGHVLYLKTQFTHGPMSIIDWPNAPFLWSEKSCQLFSMRLFHAPKLALPTSARFAFDLNLPIYNSTYMRSVARPQRCQRDLGQETLREPSEPELTSQSQRTFEHKKRLKTMLLGVCLKVFGAAAIY